MTDMHLKWITATAFAAFLSAAAMAQSVSTEAVYACSEKADDAERLACYDSAVGRLKAAEEAGEIATVTKADVEKVRRDSFGFSIPSLPAIAMPKLGGDSEELDNITNPIKSVSQDRSGKLVISLENGQVWRQIDSKPIRVNRKRPPETALVRSAALGSFMMKLDKGPLFRVRREK